MLTQAVPGAPGQGGFDKRLHVNLLHLFKEQESFCNLQKKGLPPCGAIEVA